MCHGHFTSRSRLKWEKVSLKPQNKVSHSNMKKRKTLVLKESDILKTKFFVGRWENNCRFLTARREKFLRLNLLLFYWWNFELLQIASNWPRFPLRFFQIQITLCHGSFCTYFTSWFSNWGSILTLIPILCTSLFGLGDKK